MIVRSKISLVEPYACLFIHTSFLYISIPFVVIDDEDSGEDEDFLSRTAIKRVSQQIVDSKTKKHKVRPRKKGKK